jgi:hypothetical protein
LPRTKPEVGLKYIYRPNIIERGTDLQNKALGTVVHGGRVPKDTNPRIGAVVTVLKAPNNPLGVGYVTVEDEHGNVYNAVEPKRLHPAPNG